MAVQDSEAPCRHHQQAGAREEDSDQMNRQLPLRSMESGRYGIDDDRRRENSDQHQHRGDKCEQGSDCIRNIAGLFILTHRTQSRVYRNERRRKDSFAEQILQEVRNADGCAKYVGGVGITEVVSEDALADEAGDAAEKDSGCDKAGRAPTTWSDRFRRLRALDRSWHSSV